MKITKAQLKQIIQEELEELFDEKKYEPSFYTAKEDRAEDLKDEGVPEDQAFAIADTQMSKAGKKKKKGETDE